MNITQTIDAIKALRAIEDSTGIDDEFILGVIYGAIERLRSEALTQCDDDEINKIKRA